MKPERKKYQVVPGEAFTCQTCKDKPTFKDKDLMRSHLALAHRVDTMIGDRKIIMHTDGRGYASSVHLWTVSGVEFVQHVVHPK